MVRSIERVLGEKVERRRLEGFDYKKPAPANNTEFARPPRGTQHGKRHRKKTMAWTNVAALSKKSGRRTKPVRTTAT
jgi:hypothetical protein